jgi:hypothetical protein
MKGAPMERDEAAFYNMIHDALEQHPAWLKTALLAVSDGMEGAMRKAQARSGKLDMALRCALGLAAPDRLTADAKAILNKGVLDALPEDSCASQIERKARERLSQ